jgi:hypothetical protein
MTGMERNRLKFLISVRFHSIAITVQDKRIQREKILSEISVRSKYSDGCGETHRLGIYVPEEMHVMRHVCEEIIHGKEILFMLIVAES